MRLKSIGVLRGYAIGKTQLNKIADNIEHEVEEALEFERSENAKLREERDKMDVWHSKELSAAMAEIAKLRELVQELWVSCPVHDSDCDECKHKGGRTGCELYDRMRELGVEVE